MGSKCTFKKLDRSDMIDKVYYDTVDALLSCANAK